MGKAREFAPEVLFNEVNVGRLTMFTCQSVGLPVRTAIVLLSFTAVMLETLTERSVDWRVLLRWKSTHDPTVNSKDSQKRLIIFPKIF